MGKAEKKKSLYNKVLWCTIISIIFIAILTILAMLCFGIFFPKHFDKKAEATLLASGLSVIGIAISVWAGLNIINALEKRDVEEVQATLIGTQEQVDDLSKSVEEIELVKNEQKNVYKGFFLSELLKTDYDVMSRYFYKCFSECKSITTVEYVKLVLVEQYFSQIYLEYENQFLKNFVLSRAYECVQLINDIMDQCNVGENSLLGKYLLFRKYELNFLMGYMRVGVPKYDSFIYAVEGFTRISNELFEVSILDLNEKMEIQEYTGKEENLQIAVYFVNSIGEAYSKIIEDASLAGKMGGHGVKITKEVLLAWAKKAVVFLETTVKWNQRLEDREVYYRNLGCAYERLDKLIGQVGCHAKEIISNYKKAFMLVISNKNERKERVQKTYHTLLSYYERYMRMSFGLENNTVFKEKEEFIDFLEKNKDGIVLETKEYLEHYQQVSEIAILDNPRFSLQKCLNGFAWTWIVILLLNDDNYVKEKYVEAEDVYLKKIKDNIDALDAMCIKDPYSEELRQRYLIIKDYLNEQKRYIPVDYET